MTLSVTSAKTLHKILMALDRLKSARSTIQAHWTINVDPATVVLPTGVGKTETMLSVLVAERCQRLMVVVPTDALRTQIAEKFLTLGLLKSPTFGVVLDEARFPVVGTLNKRPTDVPQVDSFFRKCNVIITTMPLASQCSPEVMQRMAELCPCLFIDEAHHVGAPTWKAFRDGFAKNRVIQFTASPFRNDDEPIGGKRIFTFSLCHAQEQNYFSRFTSSRLWSLTRPAATSIPAYPRRNGGKRSRQTCSGRGSRMDIEPAWACLFMMLPLCGIAAWRMTSSFISRASQGEPLNASKYSKKRIPAVAAKIFSALCIDSKDWTCCGKYSSPDTLAMFPLSSRYVSCVSGCSTMALPRLCTSSRATLGATGQSRV